MTDCGQEIKRRTQKIENPLKTLSFQGAEEPTKHLALLPPRQQEPQEGSWRGHSVKVEISKRSGLCRCM